MKTLKLVTVLVLLTFPQTYSQWFWQNPVPQGNDILDSYFLDENHGWAVGSYGACIKTNDGGETWKHVQMPIHNHIESVHFLDNNIGFAGDWDGNLLKTIDGGDNWTVQHIENYTHIRCFFYGRNFGWLLSTYGRKVYRTTNSGETWQSYDINTTSNFSDIYFLDSSKGFIISYTGGILMTSDGGMSWNSINSPVATVSSLFKITFKNPLEGFIGGESGILLRSFDGGNNWQVQYVGNNGISDISFLNNSRGVIVASDFKIYITNNGGSNWVEKTFSSIWALKACSYLKETNCLVFGEMGNIYKSSNNGESWQSKVSGDRNAIFDIKFISFETGFAIGENGTILKTNNRGKQWNKLSHITDEKLSAIWFNDSLNGWIIGSNATILKTTNGGNYWEHDTLTNATDLNDICFVNQNIGWIVGDGNKILKTTNGGSTWFTQLLNDPNSTSVKSIFMLNENIGYACGYYIHWLPPKSSILKTTNSGLNWETIEVVNSELNDVFFQDPFNGWVVGQTQAKTLRTTDEGMTWIDQSIGGGTAIHFSNNQMGIKVDYWALGSFITITTNGGASWVQQPEISERYLYTAFSSLDGFWAAGMNGTILFSNNPIISGIGNFNTSESRPTIYHISQNFPNPFNPSTKIKYSIPSVTLRQAQSDIGVSLKVYDILGNEIETLVNEEKSLGTYEVTWNAANLPSGVYFYQLRAGEFVETRKMILLR